MVFEIGIYQFLLILFVVVVVVSRSSSSFFPLFFLLTKKNDSANSKWLRLIYVYCNNVFFFGNGTLREFTDFVVVVAVVVHIFNFPLNQREKKSHISPISLLMVPEKKIDPEIFFFALNQKKLI